jgi:hypothetical protein
MTSSRRASNSSEHRFRNKSPKMYSLNSEASICPRRMSRSEQVAFELSEGQGHP